MEISRIIKHYTWKLIILAFFIVILASVLIRVIILKKNQTNIRKIEVVFLHPITCSPITLEKEDVVDFEYGYISELSEKNSSLLLIEKNLNKLKINNDPSNYNITIVCKVIYKNGESDELLLGSFFGTTLNGKRMQDNFELNYLIKNEIGFYDLIDYKYLHEVTDLKDTSKLNNVKINYKKKKKFKPKKIISLE